MAKTRIYHVTGKALREPVELVDYLVEAKSQSAAEEHVIDKHVGRAVVAKGKEIAELVGKGVKVEVAVDAKAGE